MKTDYTNRYLIDIKIYDYRRNFLYIPDSITIAPEYLNGLTSEEYREAANTFVRFIHHLLDCLEQDPEYYGMACIPAENDDKKNWSKTNTPFYKLTNTVQNIFDSVSDNKTQLDCKISVLKPKLPRKFPHILEIFQSFGFVITGLDAKMKPEDGENFTMLYPANPDIFRIFHSTTSEQTLWNITNWGIIAASEADRQRYPLALYLNHLEDLSLHKLLTEIHNLLSEAGLTYQSGEENHILHNALRYKTKKNSKEFMIIRLGGTVPQRISSKLRLAHIRQYEDVFKDCTDTVRNKILENKQCDHCGNCTTQIVMDHDGKHYVFCDPTWWWIAFSLDDLHDMTNADMQSVLSLLRAELPYYLEG